jgi:predicted phosphodiesterase
VKIALIADIHEDVVSLKKALKMIEREKCDQIVCLGDILGYPFKRAKYETTRNAGECIKIIKQNCSAVVPGNHDLFHAKRIPKNVSGFKFPANWYSLSPEDKTYVSDGKVWNYTDDLNVDLSEKELEFLMELPEFVLKNTSHKKVLYSHFVYPNFTGSVCSYHGDGKKIREHFSFLNQNDCQISFVGHMHIEGLGIYYESPDNFFSHLFKGFDYYSFGERKLKDKNCCVSIPALADNGQVNGFAIFDSDNFSVNALSLNTNRRFIL